MPNKKFIRPAILAAVLALVLFLGWGELRTNLRNFGRAHAYGVFAPEGPSATWFGDRTGLPAPILGIQIEEPDMAAIETKRAEAILNGLHRSENSDFVPAQFQLEGKPAKGKIRLKGLWLDHLAHDEKWSFRIHLSGNDEFLGMSRFSIQHPATRSYQAELLFHETLRHLGVLTPRSAFVRLVLNGRDLGLMFLEEHFTMDLPKAQGRPKGVLLRFDLDPFMPDSMHGQRSYPAVALSELPVDSYQSGRVSKSPELSAQYEQAKKLLKDFAQERLPASKVFDVEKLGKFLAAAELWRSWHCLDALNQRFYYHPRSKRLEPIGFDSEWHMRGKAGELAALEKQLSRRMVKDPQVATAVATAMRTLRADWKSGVLPSRLEWAQQRWYPLLHKEFWLLSRFPMNALEERGRWLEKTGENAVLEKYLQSGIDTK